MQNSPSFIPAESCVPVETPDVGQLIYCSQTTIKTRRVSCQTVQTTKAGHAKQLGLPSQVSANLPIGTNPYEQARTRFFFVVGCANIHTYKHTYTHKYIHAYLHTYIHTTICRYIHVCIHHVAVSGGTSEIGYLLRLMELNLALLSRWFGSNGIKINAQ